MEFASAIVGYLVDILYGKFNLNGYKYLWFILASSYSCYPDGEHDLHNYCYDPLKWQKAKQI